MLWKTDLHVHTNTSRCSNLTAKKIFDTCKKENINAIAITDHNTTAAAKEIKKQAPKNLHIIIGEEIATTKGDIIGLFLQETIPAKLSPQETIQRIRKQNGIVLIPHPTDSVRKEALGLIELTKIIQDVDLIETYNSRNIFPWSNLQAKKFAQKNNIQQTVGSDAHFKTEIGKSTLLIEEWKSPQDFLANLKNAKRSTKYGNPIEHLKTIIEKKRKR